MEQPNRFQQLVAAAKQSVTEISPAEAAEKLRRGEAHLIDVRDREDWDEGHAANAEHMSRGTIELDVEDKFPDLSAPIICYCGGGGRSALATESLQRMGYTNVRSLAGGLKAWKAAGLPTE
ncbi:MAG: rhodanese-like domain-containing protein [Chthoniobacterales bacterium]|jgi:phage shock protein E